MVAAVRVGRVNRVAKNGPGCVYAAVSMASREPSYVVLVATRAGMSRVHTTIRSSGPTVLRNAPLPSNPLEVEDASHPPRVDEVAVPRAGERGAIFLIVWGRANGTIKTKKNRRLRSARVQGGRV